MKWMDILTLMLGASTVGAIISLTVSIFLLPSKLTDALQSFGICCATIAVICFAIAIILSILGKDEAM